MSPPGSPAIHWTGHGISISSAMFQSSTLGAMVSALAVHAVVRRAPPRSVWSMAAMLFLPPALLTLWSRSSNRVGVLPSFSGITVIYLASLGLSVFAYRVSSFHPLADCPGPFAARVTRWWAFWKAEQGDQHRYSHQLFQQYGDVVRTGPNHLIIRDASAVNIVLGSRDSWHKAERYDTPKPSGSSGSLVLITDPAVHAPRRKLWERAFTPTALRAYEPMIIERGAQLCRILDSHGPVPIDLADLISRATFDMMGDFAYGSTFELMAGGDTSDIVNIVHQGSAAVESWGTVPWVRPLLQLVPKNKMKRFFTTAMGVAERRRVAGSKIRDLFHYLTDEDGEDGRPEFNPADLAMEAGLALIAGSETVSSTILNTIFYLVAFPRTMQKLRAELDAAHAGLGAAEIEPAALAQLPYLQAVINETMRLQPALSNGTQRTPAPDSNPIVVAGHLVPAGTTVQIPPWSLHRDERYFSPDPEMYWPERWTPEGEAAAEARGCDFRLDLNAYIPWSYGPTICVGRGLALIELRVIIAALVQHFDIRYADGFTQKQWLDGLKDRFALLTESPLLVVMTRRSTPA